jgi:outer membrane protein assembly factor BamB
MHPFLPLSTLVVSLLAPVLPALANWPQFRGRNSAGHAEGNPPPAELTQKNILWKAKLPGRGLGSPIVWGDRVFLSAATGPQQERLHVFCFGAADGKLLWERQFQATGRTMSHEKTCNAAPTPCTDGQRVFVIWSCNDLVCLDFDGSLLWLRGLTYDYPNASNSLGMASSPVVIDDTLVVMVENDSDSFTAGIDSKTGVNRWKLPRTKTANWSSPAMYESGGRRNVCLMSSDGVIGVDPSTGSTLWKVDGGGATIPSCTVSGLTLFVPVKGLSAFDLSKASAAAPEPLWSSAQLSSGTATPIAHGDSVFTVNNAGVLARAGISDGATQWKLRLNGAFSSSPVMAGALLYIPSEKGELKVVDTAAQPEGKIVSELALGETILCTPAISNGALYLRSDASLWKIGSP